MKQCTNQNSQNNSNGATGSTTVTATNWVQIYFPWYNPSPTPTGPAPKKDDRDGLDCSTCKDFYQYVEPNQQDGSYICFKCRNGY